MLLKDIARFDYSLPVKSNNKESLSRWLNVFGLLQNNEYEFTENLNSFDKDKALKTNYNCLLLKRISPTFVNVYDLDEDVCLGNNIIKINVLNDYDVYYVSLIIESNLSLLNNQANNGTRMSAINRESLGNIEIPDIPLSEQQKIGIFQKLSFQQCHLVKQLNDKIELKTNIIKGLMFDTIGGNKNGK